MIESPKTRSVKSPLFLVLVFLIATDLSILLNVPFLKQITGFLFLTILPGVLLLQILKLNKIGYTETFVLSVGLSISSLMFVGLVLNNSLLILGYKTPLSTVPLLILFNIVAIALTFVAYRLNKNTVISLTNFNLTPSEKVFLIVPVFFPALSIFGMHIMNATNNNVILMFMLFLIPTYVVFVCFFNKKFPKKLYPVVIFLISVSLLLIFSLRSNHLIGVDTHSEYYLFRTTSDNMYWSISEYCTLDACLVISLLPTIYHCILDTSPEFLFKILYSSFLSISPLIVYILSKKYVGEFYGFLTSCYFMSLHNFLWTSFHARTNTAILFFGLAMMVLFNDKIEPMKKRILFIMFMASCVVSHYSTTYISFFILLGTFLGMKILSTKYTFKKVISLKIIILFFIIIFFWYSQVTGAAFDDGVYFVKDTLVSLQDFFVEESRASAAQAMLGKDIEEKGTPHKIEFVLTWLMFAFIGIGITVLIIRYKEMSFPELNFKKPNFLREKFEVGYSVIALVCVGLLVAMVAFPHTSVGYSMNRLHIATAVILSVFFVIGGMMVAKYSKQSFKVPRGITLIRGRSSRSERVPDTGVNGVQPFLTENISQVRVHLIILLVLIPYFLCATGVMYQMFGYPREITLNSEGAGYDLFYVPDQESYAAKWLRDYTDYTTERQKIYAADFFGGKRLESQGMISPSSINTGSFINYEKIDGYIYLRYYNVVNGELMDYDNEIHNMTDYQDILTEQNEIYNNGGSKVLR